MSCWAETTDRLCYTVLAELVRATIESNQAWWSSSLTIGTVSLGYSCVSHCVVGPTITVAHSSGCGVRNGASKGNEHTSYMGNTQSLRMIHEEIAAAATRYPPGTYLQVPTIMYLGPEEAPIGVVLRLALAALFRARSLHFLHSLHHLLLYCLLLTE